MAETTPISDAELAGQLADLKKRNAARDELLQRGAPAVSALLAAAVAPQDPQHYKTILRTLLPAKDPRTEDFFRRALRDNDEEVRAIGARGLHLLKASDSLEALQAAFDDAPDPLHSLETPAARSLIELGRPALPTVFTLMESSEERTRERAYYVLASVVLADITRRLQPRPVTSEAQTAWDSLQRANGSYQWNGPEAARGLSIGLWRAWFRTMVQNA